MIHLLAQTPGDVEALSKAAETASKASDRYVAAVLIIILLIFCFAVIKHLLRDKESARADHAVALKEAYAIAATARQEHAATLKEMFVEQTKLSAELLVALQQNRELLDKVKQALERLAQKQIVGT